MKVPQNYSKIQFQKYQDRMKFIKNFNSTDFVNENCTLEQVTEIKKAFDLFDKNQVGQIDPRELKITVNSLGLGDKNHGFYYMIKQLDTCGTKLMQFQQFYQLITTGPSSPEYQYKILQSFDTWQTGYISLKELRKVSKMLGEFDDDDTLREMIALCGSEQDGYASIQEIYNVLINKKY